MEVESNLGQEKPKEGSGWAVSTPAIIQRWMQTRGIHNQAEFDQFLNFKLSDLRDPFSLDQMDVAVDRLIQAFNEQEKICLYGDFDMDGTPGLALLIKGLQLCGFTNLTSFQPNRFEHGYGVHPELVEEFIESHGVSLFVTVDVGITDVKAVDTANQKNVDFIITDHHQAKEILPKALAIVNPNKKECDSGLGHLCGTGVAFYLILALRAKMRDLGLLQKPFDPKLLLDCFTIATLTDMVPLIKENRVLVQHGMFHLLRTQRPGLRALLDELNLSDKKITSSDVAITLAPKLNALGRMNSSTQALDLFLVKDTQEAYGMVQATMEAQKDRLAIQQKGETLLHTFLSEQDNLPFVFEYSEEFYKGVVGLLATKATQKHLVASFVGALIDGKIVGSARAPKGQSLIEAMDFAKEALNKYGGHKQAAGFELDVDQADLFRDLLSKYYQQQTFEKTTEEYDFEAELHELDHGFKDWLRKLEPYGQGFKLPMIKLKHLFVSGVRVLKEKHLKMQLSDVQGNKIEALWFFADNIDEKRQYSSRRVSVIVEPSINEYQGRERLQVFIRDLKLEF